MLCWFVEMGLLIYGIVSLVKGEMKIGAGRMLRGVGARLCGILLTVPLLGGQGGEVIYSAKLGFERGMQGVQGQEFDESDKQEIQKAALIINGIALGVPLLLFVVIALTQAESEATIRRRFEDDDDDRPCSRRDEDDEDDSPRLRRREDG